MNRRILLCAAAPVMAVGLAVVPASMASAHSHEFTATAVGENEVGAEGDPDGEAMGSFTLNTDDGQFCYTVTATGLEDVAAMHIHKGAEGVNGPVVIPLDESKIGGGEACTTAETAVLQAISDNPSDYYFNVHTTALPAGAVRDQLSAAGEPGSVDAGSGGLLPDDGSAPVLPVLLLLTGGAVVAAAGWRIVKH